MKIKLVLAAMLTTLVGGLSNCAIYAEPYRVGVPVPVIVAPAHGHHHGNHKDDDDD